MSIFEFGKIPEGKKPKFGGGPHGVGDPDDRSLRKIESKVLIPQLMRQIVREKYCVDEIKRHSDCVMNAGLLLARLKCKQCRYEMGECLEIWNDSEEVHKEALESYLEQRRLYRLTGKSDKEREQEEKMKMQNEEQTSST